MRWRAADGYQGTDRGTLAQLRRLARQRVGRTPELSTRYAVAEDGLVVVEPVAPLTIADLFPDHPDLQDLPDPWSR